MCAALESVAVMNGLDPRRHTWRHGSIRWRQNRLLALVGRSTRSLPVDRQVRAVKLGVGAALVLLAFLSLAWHSAPERASDSISSAEANLSDRTGPNRHG